MALLANRKSIAALGGVQLRRLNCCCNKAIKKRGGDHRTTETVTIMFVGITLSKIHNVWEIYTMYKTTRLHLPALTGAKKMYIHFSDMTHMHKIQFIVTHYQPAVYTLGCLCGVQTHRLWFIFHSLFVVPRSVFLCFRICFIKRLLGLRIPFTWPSRWIFDRLQVTFVVGLHQVSGAVIHVQGQPKRELCLPVRAKRWCISECYPGKKMSSGAYPFVCKIELGRKTLFDCFKSKLTSAEKSKQAYVQLYHDEQQVLVLFSNKLHKQLQTSSRWTCAKTRYEQVITELKQEAERRITLLEQQFQCQMDEKLRESSLSAIGEVRVCKSRQGTTRSRS